MQHRDPTEFRKRFALYKEGKKPYENGLPAYNTGKGADDIDEATINFIIKHEGFEPDKMGKDLVTGAPWIGSGIEVPKYIEQFKKTGRWSAEDNRKAIREILGGYTPHLKQTFGGVWDTMSPERKRVLYDIAYNIGVGNLTSKKSPLFVKAVLEGNDTEAIKQMNWGNHLARGLKIRNSHRLYLWGLNPKNMLAPLDSRDYDYQRAVDLGYEPDKTGHWPSRDYETGEYLKSPTHSTIMKTIMTDNTKGYTATYNPLTGKLGSSTWIDPKWLEPEGYTIVPLKPVGYKKR